MRNIPKQPTIPPMPQEKDDESKKLIKEIKSCPYLLPCGLCDKNGQVCRQYL